MPSKDPEYFKKYYQKNKKRRAATERYRRYGITQEQFDQMLEQQSHKCFICFTDKPKGMGGWLVDHCHATSKVRGILCANCNSMLGHAKDNIATLERAAFYLELPYIAY